MAVLEPKDAYTRWAPNYPPHAHNLLMVLEEQAMLELLPDERGRTVDMACGTGRYLALLHARGFGPVVGIDQSAAMLRRAAMAHPWLVRADITSTPLRSASVGLITCGLAVGDLPELVPVMTEWARLLRPGGTVVYSDLHPRGALAGWTRTFEDEAGRGWTLRHHVHPLDAHEAAAAASGLAIDVIREPLIAPPHRFQGWPAALVIRARRRR